MQYIDEALKVWMSMPSIMITKCMLALDPVIKNRLFQARLVSGCYSMLSEVGNTMKHVKRQSYA